MPTTYAHYKFGEEVIGALPRPLQNAIAIHRELFDIGVHGPDILFYNNPLKKNNINSQGYNLHDRTADEFFLHSAEVIGQEKDQAAARAYIYGFICHFALDSECHPYIEKMIQTSGLSHSEIEMEFDRSLLKADYLNPIRYPVAKHIHPTTENADVIAPFFENVTSDAIVKTLKSMIFWLKTLQGSTPLRRKLILGGMKLSGQYESLHGMVMSLDPNPATREYCRILKGLFSGAVPLASSLIISFQKTLFDGNPLPERFHRTFGAGDDWKNIRI